MSDIAMTTTMNRLQSILSMLPGLRLRRPPKISLSEPVSFYVEAQTTAHLVAIGCHRSNSSARSQKEYDY